MAAAFAIMAGSIFAADEPQAPETHGSNASWIVVVDALAVKLPQDKLLALMPGLLDDSKITHAVGELLDGVKRKEFILCGCPMVTTKSGQHAISETTQAVRFLWPMVSLPHHYVGTDPVAFIPVSGPFTWVGRLMGVTLEVEPVVEPDPRWIDLNFALSDVDVPARPGVALQKVNPPILTTMKNTSSIMVRSGRYVLVGVHKVQDPGGYVEIFLIRAETRVVE